jgi:epoxyqueuosine reductase QueG
MENHFDKRLDPRLLVEGSKSVISLSYNYFPEEKISFWRILKSQNMLMLKITMKLSRKFFVKWLLSCRKK